MKNIQKVYIVREYMLTDDYGGVRIDEEAVFSTLEEANNFLKTLEDKAAEGNDFLLFRIEILECALGQKDAYLRKWVYNVKGELLDKFPPLYNSPETSDFNGNGRFEIGDIVNIAPKIENKLSPSTKGTYGVIIETPSVHGYHRTEAGKVEYFRREYTIYFITESGLLDHVHAVKSVLSKLSAEVPTEFRFLEIFSKHLKNEKKLPESLISKLLNETIFVKNIKVFDFHSERIKDVLRSSMSSE